MLGCGCRPVQAHDDRVLYGYRASDAGSKVLVVATCTSDSQDTGELGANRRLDLTNQRKEATLPPRPCAASVCRSSATHWAYSVNAAEVLQ